MLDSNGKRHYCIDDIINECKPSKRQPLGDATNYCLPNIAERKGTVGRSRPGGEAGVSRDEEVDVDVDAQDREPVASASSRSVEALVESLLPCRKISLDVGRLRGKDARTLIRSFPSVHVFPQRPIKSLEALDATSLRERHCDWCTAFRSAYQRGCRVYVTHSTFAAVFWPDRGMAMVSRATAGFKRLLETFGVSFDDVRGKQGVIVVGRGKGDKGGKWGKGTLTGQAAVHGLFDVILNEVVCTGVASRRKDIFRADFPRLYCEETFRHSSAMAWEETFDLRRGVLTGFLPAWVLEGLLVGVDGRGGRDNDGGDTARVASYEKMPDLSV